MQQSGARGATTGCRPYRKRRVTSSRPWDRERPVVCILQIARAPADERVLAEDGSRIGEQQKLDVGLAALASLVRSRSQRQGGRI
jgi:hypothetical protein